MDTKSETRHANHQADETREHARHDSPHEIKPKLDTKRETRHANCHMRRRGNTRDTSRDMRLKLQWIQIAKYDTRISRRDEETHETQDAM